ncbi:dTDP-4-dehydrorhamnose reductase [Leptospira ilyithenensis]|uniref:dTDP-4-dehydrorhamnose reductase n=1 Tax=Leptospira ilyithenensis TaxID=2484901 RepID=A0A4R9LKB0_9LEPT|nr:dTDP-4-dehydrorhamnose reductase [Leptospira ilyithenensis]TGN07962.1 dTDP-4-dehydrorhamnose reductase [Leptospira ilyithenensis]
MHNVLVTGANGQLGSELKDISGKYSDQFVFHFADRSGLNLSDANEVDRFLKEKKIQSIVNAAAYTAVDLAESEIDKASEGNVTIPKLLAELSFQHRIYLIHFSTDFVFDGKSSIPYKEEDLKSPVSVYGKTKSEGEDFVLSSNPNASIIRTSWVYSKYGKNFLKTILKLSSERPELKVIFDQVGTPTWANDLAGVCIAFLFKQMPGIFHYSNEGVASWYDFAKEIVEISKNKSNVLPIETKDYPTPAKRPHYSLLNKSKIKTSLEISIPHWKDSLKECMKSLSGA